MIGKRFVNWDEYRIDRRNIYFAIQQAGLGSTSAGGGAGATGGSVTFTDVTITGLTASLPVVTDAAKQLASMAWATFKANLAIAQADVAGLTTASSPSFVGLTLSGMTAGRVAYYGAGGVMSGSANLVWDNTNARLGIGTATPGYPMDVAVAGIAARFGTDPAVLAVGTPTAVAAFVGGYYAAAANVSSIYFGQNIYFDGTWKRGDVSVAKTSLFLQQEGAHCWFTGTTDLGTIKMTITNAGNVAIEKTLEMTNGRILVPNGNSALPSYSFTNSLNSGIYFGPDGVMMALDGVARQIWSGTTGHAGFTQCNIFSPSSTGIGDGKAFAVYALGDTYAGGIDALKASSVAFSSGTSTNGLSIIAQAATGDIRFYTGGLAAENHRAIISSTGNVGIGQTTFGTNLAKGLAQGLGTAPTTSPADAYQAWCGDIDGAAGKAGMQLRYEHTGTMHVGGILVKADAGDPAYNHNGLVCINTNDTNEKIYANGAWNRFAFWGQDVEFNSVEVDAAEAYYLGDKATNTSWRIIRDGDDLSFERREAGAWVSKGVISA